MMSFKSFLQTQDDQISDEEAIKKYGEYKLEFKRQQLNEFFVTHKEEEWFKQKYHPDESVKRKEELRDFLKKRVEVFQEFLQQGKIEDLQMDCDAQDSLIRILDSVVIKLEGGTDFDLKSLDLPDEEEGGKKEKESNRRERSESAEEKGKGEGDSPQLKKAKEFLDFLETPKNEESKKRKREDGDEEDGEDEEEGQKEKENEEEKEEKTDDSENTEVEKDAMDDAMKGEDEEVKEKKDDEEKMDDEEKDTNEEEEKDRSPKPRALHKTSSIFLRNLPPTVTKQEVEAMCRRYEGFLRSAIADPAPDRRWFRRGWVTYKRTVKIKDICYNLNNIRYIALSLSRSV